MLELYQAYGDHTEMMDITRRLIVTASEESLGGTEIAVAGERVDLADEWPRRRMVDLVAEATGVEVHPTQPLDVLRELATSHGVAVEAAWAQGKLIEELFEATAESSIVRPTFVTGHPLDISPLARADRDDPALAERFELFVDGREIANGYSELNDPIEQRARLVAEQELRDAGDADRGVIDEDYLRALEFGMPPTGGLGVGIDRLAMLLAGVDTIKEVILFPTLRPEQ